MWAAEVPLPEAPKVTVDESWRPTAEAEAAAAVPAQLPSGTGGITSTPARGGGPPGEKAGNGSGGVTLTARMVSLT